MSPTSTTPPTKPELYAQRNGSINIRIPNIAGKKRPITVKTGTANATKARAVFARYLKKNRIEGIDAMTDPINSVFGLLDPSHPHQPGFQIKKMAKGELAPWKPNGHASESATDLELADIQAQRAKKSEYNRRYNKKRLAKINGHAPTKGDNLEEARDLIQIIAGAWAAASTAFRRLEELLKE